VGKLKVLHIWNTAGVGSIIAKYMDKTFGTESWVIMRKRFDKFGLTTYGECWDCGSKTFTLKALLEARKYDLIHVHDFDKIVPLLKRIYSKKPVVLHYHGSRIRGKAEERYKYYCNADFIIVSTPDLLETLPDATYVPNPVDTEFFRQTNKHNDNSAVYIIKHQLGEDLEWARKMAEKYGLNLSFRDRVKNPIPHVELPSFLNQFSYYIDRDYIKSLSKTALEALACGLKVIDYKERIIHPPLPSLHRPEKVVNELYQIYQQICKSRLGESK